MSRTEAVDGAAHRADAERERSAALRRALVAWYRRRHRPLPWRDAEGRARGGAYGIWVAEVMLQQTQVATVAPYWERWMARFPDVRVLAAAPLEAVLAVWQGLGYYRRAHNLHRAAGAIVARHGGRLPDDVAALRRLPGIGDYTAGAVASIAFDRPVPAVDGNVRRVLARLDAVEGDPSRGAAARRIRRRATELVTLGDPEEGRAVARVAAPPGSGAGDDGSPGIGSPGDVNQAVMELGATVCLPRGPRCSVCPVAFGCVAHAAGRVADFPAPAPRAGRRAERVLAFALCHPRDMPLDPAVRWLVARRPEGGLLGGLWEFPLAPGGDAGDAASALAELGLAARGLRALAPATHVFTHIRRTAVPLVGRAREMPASPPAPYTALRWATLTEIQGPELATSAFMRTLAAAVAEDLGTRRSSGQP